MLVVCVCVCVCRCVRIVFVLDTTNKWNGRPHRPAAARSNHPSPIQLKHALARLPQPAEAAVLARKGRPAVQIVP